MHLFPELHMDISKLRQRTGKKEQNTSAIASISRVFSYSKTVQSWKKEANRRAFFDKFAASKGMDPRDPHFWSSVGMQELQRYQPVSFLPTPLAAPARFYLIFLFLSIVLFMFFCRGSREYCYTTGDGYQHVSCSSILI